MKQLHLLDIKRTRSCSIYDNSIYQRISIDFAFSDNKTPIIDLSQITPEQISFQITEPISATSLAKGLENLAKYFRNR